MIRTARLPHPQVVGHNKQTFVVNAQRPLFCSGRRVRCDDVGEPLSTLHLLRILHLQVCSAVVVSMRRYVLA